MKKYRLKKEAVPFFLEKYATDVYSLDTWVTKCGIDIRALEEVETAFITYGKRLNDNAQTLGGWSKDEGTTFEFTIHFPSVNFREHDKFSEGRVTRELMNGIQNEINTFYDNFLSKNTLE